MKFEYECWKCPEWHEENLRGVLSCFTNGYSRSRIRLSKLSLTIPNPVGYIRRLRYNLKYPIRNK